MTTDNEILQKAKSLLEDFNYKSYRVIETKDEVIKFQRSIDSYWAGQKLLEIVPDLIDLVEKWQAIAIEERAKQIEKANSGDFIDDHEQHFYTEMPMEKAKEIAKTQLQAESSDWKRVGEEEIETIKFAIAICSIVKMPATDDRKEVKILRRLIAKEEEKHDKTN